MTKVATIFKGFNVALSDSAKQSVLDQATKNLSGGTDLLIKMEVRRLLKECPRVIDLRGKVDGECDFFELNGLNHSMDEIAKEVFDQQMQIYGFYSVGVYEAVHKTENNFRVRYEKELKQAKQQKTRNTAAAENQSDERPQVDHIVPSFTFSDIDRRKEERVNFLCSVDLMTRDNLFLSAQSMDLSQSGIRIKTKSKEPLEPGQVLGLYFTGLSSKFVLDDIDGEKYEVVNVNQHEEEQHAGLKRVNTDKLDAFGKFIRDLIRTAKPLRKVNVSNSLRALQLKAYEQYYSNATTTFPVFLLLNKGRYIPRFVLYNDVNEKSLYYWASAQGEINLDGLLSKARIKLMINNPGKLIQVYTFTKTLNGEIHYYIATEPELRRDPQLRSSFLSFASNQGSWRVFQMEAHPVSAESALRPLSTPAGKKDGENADIHFNEKVNRLLANIPYAVFITDVTVSAARAEYQRHRFNAKYLKVIQKFRHSGSPDYPVHSYHFADLELEQKTAKSPVLVRTRVLVEIDGKEIEGVSEDLFATSLQASFKEAFPGEPGKRFRVSFPELQERRTKYRHDDLFYEVAEVDNAGRLVTFNVFRARSGMLHPMENFFAAYSRNIADAIRDARQKYVVPELGGALRNIFLSLDVNRCVFMKRVGNYRLPLCAARPKTTDLKELTVNSLFEFGIDKVKKELFQNTYSLFSSSQYDNNDIVKLLGTFPAKNLGAVRYGVRRELFLAYFASETRLEKAFISRFSDEFDSRDSRTLFIEKARSRGEFFALQIIVTQAGQVNWDNMRIERQYVRKNAAGALTRFENDVKRVVGCIEVVDITQTTIARYRA